MSTSLVILTRSRYSAYFIDLSAAFDTVDHPFLWSGWWRTGLDPVLPVWALSVRPFQRHSVLHHTRCVYCVAYIPQGSVLGPVLFLLYASGVIKLIQNCGLSAHSYADDLQVYGHINPAQSATLMARMADCITRIGVWMASNRLCLNPAKTEVIWLGSTRRVTHCSC